MNIKSQKSRTSGLTRNNRVRQPDGGQSEPVFRARTPSENLARLVLSGVSPVQTKLSVSKPGDPLEREADAMAERVMTMSDPVLGQEESIVNSLLQRQELPEEEEQLQLQEETEEEEFMAQPIEEEEEELQLQQHSHGDMHKSVPMAPSRLDSTREAGRPLPESTRAFMEKRFGTDFRGVRVHTSPESVAMSRGLRAQAFTRDRNIYFNAGTFEPGTSAGRRLIAHELTHVIQQGATGRRK